MYFLLLAACLSLASAGKPALPFNCTGLPNGMAWWGCRAFGECDNDEHFQTDCMNGTAFDQNSESCVEESQAAFPCNRQADCSALNGTVHRIPEMEVFGNNGYPCQFYYTCNYGHFAGHQICPGDLVYNEDAQDCQNPKFVPAPCGDLETNNSNNNNFNNNNNNNNFNNNNFNG